MVVLEDSYLELHFSKKFLADLNLLMHKIICNFTEWKGSSGTHERKCLINWTKWLFFHINQTCALFNKENTLVQKLCMFLQKETSYCKNSMVLDPQGPNQFIFGNCFSSNNDTKLRFHVFLLFHVINHEIILPEVDKIHKKLWVLFQLWVPRDRN